MTQKYLSHPLLVFYPHKTVRKDLIDRNHAGSSKARSAQVLRNSPRAMPLSGYELVRPEITCDESALLCVH